MQILPVLDLLNGIVVRGVAGRRSEYRPARSGLVCASDPLIVARAFREQFGLTRLYIADLDGILQSRPNFAVVEQLRADAFHLLVDAGVREATLAERLLAAGCEAVIVGLETCPAPEQLADCVNRCGAERIVFSLDLKDGQPMRSSDVWPDDPLSIVESVAAMGIRRLIVLDLTHVGMGTGLPTGQLCRILRERFPSLGLITGGGIRGPADLRELNAIGVEGALVASALHDGRLSRADIDSLG